MIIVVWEYERVENFCSNSEEIIAYRPCQFSPGRLNF